MLKQYKANSAVSLNIVLKGGKSAHVTFTPLSNGTSVYSTTNEEVQKALERHYRFGELFRQQPAAAAQKPKTAAKAEAKAKTLTVKVTDIGKARDYIADKTGTSRSKLRSKEQILAAAKAAGVEFEGLE